MGHKHKTRQVTRPWDDTSTDQEPCTVCDGTGKVETTIQDDRVRDPAKLKTIMADCPYCGGTGKDSR